MGIGSTYLFPFSSSDSKNFLVQLVRAQHRIAFKYRSYPYTLKTAKKKYYIIINKVMNNSKVTNIIYKVKILYNHVA